MAENIEEVKKHIRVYLIIGTSLIVLTGVTVAASYLHIPLIAAIILALFIATVKGSLVVCYFMHLISEKKLIYAVLIVTVIFFFVLMLVPMWTDMSRVEL